MENNNQEREFFTLTDEEGNEIEFELIGSAEINGTLYYAMIPADAAEKAQSTEDGFCEYVAQTRRSNREHTCHFREETDLEEYFLGRFPHQ